MFSAKTSKKLQALCSEHSDSQNCISVETKICRCRLPTVDEEEVVDWSAEISSRSRPVVSQQLRGNDRVATPQVASISPEKFWTLQNK